MMPTLKAEFRKVFSIRSTYIVMCIILALAILFGFYVSGWRIDAHDLHDPMTLSGDVTGAITTVSEFLGLIAILLMTHEYRYNTILHTLTLTNRRVKVLIAKILIITGVAVVFTLAIGVLAPLLALLGAHAHHLKLVHQTLYYKNLLWRGLYYGWGYAMAGLLLAALIKNQIGTIITLYLALPVVEQLLGLIIKSHIVYLPLDSLDSVIHMGRYQGSITDGHAALVFGGWLVLGWIVAFILFLKRDAN